MNQIDEGQWNHSNKKISLVELCGQYQLEYGLRDLFYMMVCEFNGKFFMILHIWQSS